MKVIYLLDTLLTTEDGADYIVTEDDYYIELGGFTGEIEVSTYNLFDLTYRLARELGIVEESTATADGTSSLVTDTHRDEDDDYWNNGTLWLVRDDGGLSADPEGSYSIIDDYTQSTGAITLRDALSGSSGTGDKYAIASKRYPLNILVQMINNALTDMGTVPTTDITSLTTINDQTEYTLPLAAKEDLRQVWLQVDTTDANDNRWMMLYNWRIQQAATGTQATLVFPYQPVSPDYDFKLVYMSPHPELSEYDDQLSEFIPIERVIYPAAAYAMKWYKRKLRGRDAELDADIERYEQKAELAKMRNPIPVPTRTGKIMLTTANMAVSELDDVNVVHLG